MGTVAGLSAHVLAGVGTTLPMNLRLLEGRAYV